MPGYDSRLRADDTYQLALKRPVRIRMASVKWIVLPKRFAILPIICVLPDSSEVRRCETGMITNQKKNDPPTKKVALKRCNHSMNTSINCT